MAKTEQKCNKRKKASDSNGNKCLYTCMCVGVCVCDLEGVG